MKILLTGNPNVGKTTLFNALTGAHNRTGNYHGVTVGVSEKNSSKRLALGLIADLPGLYSLDGMSMEEKLAAKYIDDQKGDFLVVQVADAEHFKRSLKLTNSLLSRGLPVVLVLTMCKKFRARGGKLDCGRLSEAFGIRCIETDALRRKSVKALAEALKEVFLSLSQYREKCRLSPLRDKKFFSEASSNVLSTGDSFGKYFSTAYSPAPVGADKLTNLCLNAFFALPAFFALIGLVFFFTFGEHMPGVRLKEALEGLIERFAGFCGERIESPVVRSLVCDGFLGGIGSVLSFVPQIALMYLFLDFLEESGFMSALAFMTDGLFSKIGLSGRAAFSVLLGYGCTAAAIVSTRALEEKAIQKRAVACLYFVPCSAKLPVYLTLLSSVFENTFLGALLLYILGTGMGLAVAAFLKKDDSIFLMEIADICFPDIFFVIKKLLFQIKQFIIKISTTVLAFTLVVWFLSSFSFSGVCSAEDSFLALSHGDYRLAGRLCRGQRAHRQREYRRDALRAVSRRGAFFLPLGVRLFNFYRSDSALYLRDCRLRGGARQKDGLGICRFTDDLCVSLRVPRLVFPFGRSARRFRRVVGVRSLFARQKALQRARKEEKIKNTGKYK